MKQYIKYMCITGFLALFLSACGGGGGNASSNDEGIIISLSGINCVSSASTADIEAYVTLQSEDTIVKDDANTTVEIYHSVDGTKKVCLVGGVAHVQR